MTAGFMGFGLLFVVIFGLFIYFIPSIIALSKKKSNAVAIIVLNIFLGWSLLGWVIALVWALTADQQAQTVIINNQPPQR